MLAPIFVVDSSPAVRRMVEQISAPEGFEVVGFHDGPAALEAARRNSPSLIIADYHLDNMTFSGFCKEINKLENLTETFLISLIDSADHPDEHHLRTLGVKAFIKKPFQSEDLLDILKSLQQKSEASSNSQSLKRRTWPPTSTSTDSDEDAINPIVGTEEPLEVVHQRESSPLPPPSSSASTSGSEGAMKGLFDQLVHFDKLLHSVRTQTEKKLTDTLPHAIEETLTNHVRPMVQKELQSQLGNILSQEYLTILIQPLVTQTIPGLLKQELATSEPMIRRTLSDLIEPLIKTMLDHHVRSQIESQLESMVRQHLPSILREHLNTIDQVVKDEVHRVTQAHVADVAASLIQTTTTQTVERAVQHIVPEVAEQQIKAEIKRLLDTEEVSNQPTS